MTLKEKSIKIMLTYLVLLVISFSMCNINLLNNYFVFIIPFICFCFFFKKSYGIFSFFSSCLFLWLVNKWFILLMICVGASYVVLKGIVKSSELKLKTILCFYNFSVVFLFGIVSGVIYQDKMFVLSFCGILQRLGIGGKP